ncbi:hypothetical protein [Alloalcanivorax venustensis]|uniref:hypothetical protein n=1 Tax=Alloalcanivorax venustensis TaxID=172371 RepID=UPI003514872C
MKRAKEPLIAAILAISVMAGGTFSSVDAQAGQMEENDRPGEIAMLGDAVIVRPVMAGATVVGTVVYTVMLPFTLLGGNEDEAAETLVKTPARTTFLRCLGCTPTQHDRLRRDKKIETQRTAEK